MLRSLRYCLTVVSIVITGNAYAEESAYWRTYEKHEHGFRLAYPAEWLFFEQTHTRFQDLGLPAVFTLCLTPGPVKTLSCQVEFFVIPEAKFVAPTAKGFLGLPGKVADMNWSAIPSWGLFKGEPFLITDGSVSWTNHITHQNGFVYLWSYSSMPLYNSRQNIERMLSSIRFFPLNEANADKSYCHDNVRAKDWPNPMVRVGPYAIDVLTNHLTLGRMGMSAQSFEGFIANDILPLDWRCGKIVGLQKTKEANTEIYEEAIRILKKLDIKIILITNDLEGTL